MTKISIIDDHKIVRQGLKELLEKLGDYQVISEYESGEIFLNSLPEDLPADIYILDYSMPVLNGIDVLKQLEEKEEEYKILLLTQHFEETIIDEAYKYGARGFLHKNCAAQDLKFVIDNIIKIGYNNISEILKRIKNYDINHPHPEKKQIDLTAREQEFLKLVCNEREYTYEQMSEIMGLSVKTIEGYRVALFDRYGIKSKVGLVLFSFKHKLTEPFL